MSLYEKIESDMKASLKSGEAAKLSVLRMLVAALRKAEMDSNKKSIDESDVLQMIQRHVKQHKESISQFVNGKRQDLADKEIVELKILESYLPEQIGEAELTAIVAAVIAENLSATKAEMGKVMKLVMERAKGRADGKLVSQLVMRSLK